MPSLNAPFHQKFKDIFEAKPQSIRILFSYGQRFYLVSKHCSIKIYPAQKNNSLDYNNFLIDVDSRFANLKDNRNIH